MNTNITEKICIITSGHKRNDVRIYLKQVKSLVKNNFNISMIVADGEGDEKKDNVKIYDVGKEKSRYKRFLISPKKIYKKSLELDADIYHFHDPDLIKTGKKLLKKGKKIIYDVHEHYPRQIVDKPYIPKFIRPLLSRIFEMHENSAVKKFNYIITATPLINDRFLKINKNSVDISNFPLLEELILDSEWSEKKREICYIGGISVNRGIQELVDSLKFSDARLNLAGDFKDNSLYQKIKNQDEWNKVNFYGYVNREEVVNILRKSKIGIVTVYPVLNFIGGQPVKMFEYMAAGLPVIASNFHKSIVEKYNCGICVNPKDHNEIANAINKLLNNDNLSKQMGENGKKAAKEVFNWSIEEEKLLNVYKKLILSEV